MGNSVVDLGAAAVGGVADFFSESYDFLFGTPEASASGGYYKKLGPGARQYFPGPGEYEKTNPVMEYFGFEDGGSPAVELQDDGSLPGVDALRYMTPQEVEDGSYSFLQNMEEKMRGHLAAAQSVHAEDIPVRQSLDMKRYHYEEAEKLRDQIEQFKERRASAIQNYPESETKLYMKEGESPYVRGFPDDLVQGFDNGGVASLGAAEPALIEMGDMSMNDALGLIPGDRAYSGEFPGRVYREGDQITDPYYLGPEYNFEAEDPRRFDLYEDSGQFAPPLTDQGIRSFDEEGRARPTYPSFQEYIEVDESGKYPAFGIMASLGKDEDTTGPLQADPDYPGIEGFDIYRGLAPEQFKRRRIQDQKFDKKRGFQFGQMVSVEREEAVDEKLFKMAGLQPGAALSPRTTDQVSRILGRDVG